MFQGDLTLGSTRITSDLIVLVTFFSVVVLLARDDRLDIPLLDVVQTLFCWPSFFECILIPLFLWLFRDFERMLGLRAFAQFLGLNFLAFFPFFLGVLLSRGVWCHYSLPLFLPYSLFLFMVWHIPATPIVAGVHDKHVALALFIALFCYELPTSFLTLTAAVLGLMLSNRLVE
jgi:hypothetical protein